MLATPAVNLKLISVGKVGLLVKMIATGGGTQKTIFIQKNSCESTTALYQLPSGIDRPKFEITTQFNAVKT